MSKANWQSDKTRLLATLDKLIDQWLIDYPDEADAILKMAGRDPDEVGKKVADFAQLMMDLYRPLVFPPPADDQEDDDPDYNTYTHSNPFEPY